MWTNEKCIILIKLLISSLTTRNLKIVETSDFLKSTDISVLVSAA